MKLRIRGNSVRLRLTRSEVSRIAAGRAVTESVRFGSATELRYRVEPRPVPRLAAEMVDGEIAVLVPAEQATQWAATDQVSLAGGQDLGAGERLEILVEKDFACLKPRPGDDPEDFFENPGKASG